MIIALLTGRSVEKSVEEVKDCLEEVNETFEKEKEENMRQMKHLGKYSDQSDVDNKFVLISISRGEKLE